MHCARIARDVVQRNQYVQDLYDLLSLGSTSKKNTVCLLPQILTSRYHSIVDNRMKIERAPNVVNVIEYFQFQSPHCPVT